MLARNRVPHGHKIGLSAVVVFHPLRASRARQHHVNLPVQPSGAVARSYLSRSPSDHNLARRCHLPDSFHTVSRWLVFCGGGLVH